MHTRPFNLWLKQLRTDRDLTQDALAEQVGCSVDAIRAFESNRRRPSRAMSERLADVLALPLAERVTFVQLARAVEPPSEPPPPSPVVTEAQVVITNQTQRRRRQTLPTASNILIGRERELSDLATSMSDPHCRLLTLVGAGGVGKTSLALQLAANLAGHFADGAVWVALEGVDTAEHVAPAIADAIGLQLQGGVPAQRQVLDDLRERELLLVLDNLEHLLDAVDLFGAILAEAPAVKMLVTSRERLRIRGEWAVDLGGLALPQEQTVAGVARSAAVLLFLERARQVDHRWALTPHNQAQVVQICRLLDGMPLGIELAASWVQALSVAEIAAELERTLDLPESAVRDLPARHRSLRAVFDHSWQLLTPIEQGVLGRLAIFRGGWERAAASAVADASLPTLAALADKSLVRRVATGRYEMHPLIRHFATEQLDVHPGWAEDAAERHATYYAGWLKQREQPLRVAMSDDGVIAEFRAETDNLRPAWDWLIAHRQAALMREAAGCLAFFFELRCWLHEGSELFERAASSLAPVVDTTDPALPTVERLAYGQMLACAGFLALRGGNAERGRMFLQRSLDVVATQSDQEALFRPTFGLGVLLLGKGEYRAAQQHFSASLRIAQQRQDHYRIAWSQTMLGEVAHRLGQLDEAERLLTAALAIWRAIGGGTAPCLTRLGAVLLDTGEYAKALPLLQESVAISSQRDDPEDMATALVVLGKAALLTGQAEVALYFGQESVATFRRVGVQDRLAKALVVLGEVHAAQHDWSAARTAFTDALRIAHPLEFVPITLNALYGLASVAVEEGSLKEALRLLLHVLTHPATEARTRAEAEQLRAVIEGRLPGEEVAALNEAAREESLQGVVNGVLRDTLT